MHFNVAVVSKSAYSMGKPDTKIPSPKSPAISIVAFHFPIIFH